MKPTARLHDLDAMRSTLMLLGIVLHSANPYRAASRWLIHDQATAGWADMVVRTIHFFRMPAFFVVAGYFLSLAFDRYRPGTVALDRARRLLLPCLTTLLLLNIPQQLLLASGPPGARADVPGLVAAWWNGALIGHLWFLVDLFIYSALAVAGLALSGGRLARLLGAIPSTGAGLALLIAIGIAGEVAAAAAAMISRHVAAGYLLGLTNLPELLSNAGFLLGGMVLHRSPGMLAAFRSPGIPAAAVAAASWGIVATLGDGGGRAGSLVRLVAGSVIVWYAVRICFLLFHRFASSESRLFRYLSDASYSLYLFHHIVVVVTASLLIPSPMPPLAKFLAVMAVATLIPLAVHHFVVLRYPLPALLFNGRNTGSGIR